MTKKTAKKMKSKKAANDENPAEWPDAGMPPTSKKKAPKQQTLGKDFERKKIDEVENAAEDYRSTRDERMALQLTEAEKQATLDEVLEKHAIKKYVYFDEDEQELEAYIPDTKPKAKVRKVKNKKSAE